MFSDLNFDADHLEPFAARERAATAASLGYNVIAVAHTAVESLSAKDRCPTQATGATSTAAPAGHNVTASRESLLKGQSRELVQLSRLTVTLEEPAAAAQLLSLPADSIAASYDILAVQPMSERILQQACTSMEVDIITFDLSKRLPFRLKPALLQTAVKRGVHLEICYAAAIRDESLRRSCFANALALSRAVGGKGIIVSSGARSLWENAALSRAVGGKGIIVSSGARSMWEMRAPHDIMNLSTLFGLKQQQAKDAVSERCAAVIRHSEKRRAYRGSLRLLKQPADPEEAWQPQKKFGASPIANHPQPVRAGYRPTVTGKRRRQQLFSR